MLDISDFQKLKIHFCLNLKIKQIKQCKNAKFQNLIINKQENNFDGELFPPKIQCPNQFIKCPCLNHE